jgi:hypothetical protein
VAAADEFNKLPLNAWCVGSDLGDPEGTFTTTCAISTAGAVLVRPDGFVAWRSPGAASDGRRSVRDALARSLGHSAG